jgi:hypothetical protein
MSRTSHGHILAHHAEAVTKNSTAMLIFGRVEIVPLLSVTTGTEVLLVEDDTHKLWMTTVSMLLCRY